MAITQVNALSINVEIELDHNIWQSMKWAEHASEMRRLGLETGMLNLEIMQRKAV